MTFRIAGRVDLRFFDKIGIVLLGIDSKGRAHELYSNISNGSRQLLGRFREVERGCGVPTVRERFSEFNLYLFTS